ncbi:LuxR family transcriptional regulator [Streptomyces sp. CB00316]|uniref:helix-turn-helix transcriptional regulator n=1 Tax=unclassified Streptomyces TaxID=2593676 RepID=UPI0009594392|nr:MULTISPECIES: PAS domain-containing protein [unclassified Streptomyces]OKJ21920.1 LuxR family transcriptional regulator [Streptomyces sp. CB00316]
MASGLKTDQNGYGGAQGFDRPGLCVASLDPALTVRQANEEFFRRFGDASAEVYGRSFRELVHPSVQQPLMRQFSRLVEGKRQRFVSHVVAVGPEEAFAGTLTAAAVSGGTSDLAAILVLMRSSDASEEDAGVVTHQKKILTEIDARILEGIAAGMSTIPLASRLHLSRQGVEYHVTGLLRKLRVPNRAALVSRAYSMGVLNVGTWPPKVVGDFIK